MGTAPIDHPIVAVLAFLTALPFGWPVIRAFVRSAADDVEEAVESPFLSHLGMFPEWTIFKFVWLLIVLLALTITFYKLYTYVGGFLGLIA